MSVKQAIDAGFFKNNNAVAVPSTLDQVLIASNNQTNEDMTLNSDLTTNSMQVNNMKTNAFVYSNPSGFISNTIIKNYMNSELSNQSILNETTTTVVFNSKLNINTSVGLVYDTNTGIFTNSNSTRVIYCLVSYYIRFNEAYTSGSRGALIACSNGTYAGIRNCDSQLTNVAVTGSTILMLKPSETFHIEAKQSSLKTMTIKGSVEVLVF
jgi:hypothetical protein